jgi:hypothetical protein
LGDETALPLSDLREIHSYAGEADRLSWGRPGSCYRHLPQIEVVNGEHNGDRNQKSEYPAHASILCCTRIHGKTIYARIVDFGVIAQALACTKKVRGYQENQEKTSYKRNGAFRLRPVKSGA